MVPMAPSATITRLANWSRNSWARVVVGVVMRNGRKCRWKRGKCDMFQFNAGGLHTAHRLIPSPWRQPSHKLLGRTQPACDFRSALRIVPNVPAINRLSLGFDGAVRKHGVVDAAAHNAPGNRCFKRIGIFIAVQRDDGKALPYAADEQHSLLSADAMFARHPR